MQIFDADTDPTGGEFAAFRDRDGGSLVINRSRRREGMLHRAACIHFDFNAPVNLSAKPKICAPTRTALEAWARREGVRLRDCQTCLK